MRMEISSMKIVDNKIAIIGDIHIGVNKNSNKFFELTKEWLRWFISEVEEKKIRNVFILGDWFHYRDEISLLALDEGTECLKLFPKTINVHILTGNHDCYFRDNSEVHSLGSYNEWENVFIYDTVQTIEHKNGKTISMVPWGYEYDDIPKTDIMFGHFEIKNFKLNSYTICKKGVNSSDLLKKSSLIFSGHFHKHQVKNYKAGSITYVGSPFQHNFGDIGNENGYHIMDMQTKECEFIQNPDKFPVFHYVKLSKLKETFDKDKISENFVKLIIDKDINEASMDKMVSKINMLAPLDLNIDTVTSKIEVDNSEIDANIVELNIFDSVQEYVKGLNYEYEDELIKEGKKYYEKHK